MLTPCKTPRLNCGFLGTDIEDEAGIANLSAEAPDVDISVALPHPPGWIQPPIGGGGITPNGDPVSPINNPDYTGPQPCAEEQKGLFGFVVIGGSNATIRNCSPVVPPPDDPPTNPDWPDPNPNPDEMEPRALIGNEPQTCTKTCPDGTISTVTIPENTYWQLTRALANQMALSQACKQATLTLFCINGSLPAVCVGASYSNSLTISGLTNTYTWAVTSGALPPGLSILANANGTSLGVVGIPSAAGNYAFTLTATNANSVSHGREFTIAVVAVAGSLPDGQVGVAYSQIIGVEGGSGDYTFALLSGTIPTGLTLSAAGVLSGTPTEEALFSFIVSVTRSGVICTEEFIVDIAASVACPAYIGAISGFNEIEAQVAYDPVNDWIFIGGFTSQQVHKVDPATNTILASTAAMGGSIGGMVYVPGPTTVDANPAIVFSAGSDLYQLNPVTMVTTLLTALSAQPQGPFAYTPVSNRVAIACSAAPFGADFWDLTIGVLLHNNGTVSPFGFIYDVTLGRFYCRNYDPVTNPGVDMLALEDVGNTTVGTLTFPVAGDDVNNGSAYAFRVTGGKIYMATHNNAAQTNSVHVVDAATFTLSSTIALDSDPLTSGPIMGYSSELDLVIASVSKATLATNQTVIIDPATDTVVCTIEGTRANGVGIDVPTQTSYYVSVRRTVDDLAVAELG